MCGRLLVMILYLGIILIGMVLTVLLNWLALGWSLIDAIVWTSATTGIEIGINIALVIISGLCVPHIFYRECKLYAVGKGEMNFYRAIRLNNWKDSIIELGFLGGFSKKKIATPDSPAYVDKFIYELNKGMFVHYIGVLGSFIVLALPLPGFWSVSFIVAMFSVVLNILPLMVLRYNKPRLLLLKKRLERNQARTVNVSEKIEEPKEPVNNANDDKVE